MRWWSPIFAVRCRACAMSSRRSRAGRGRAGGAAARAADRGAQAGPPHRPRDRAGRRLCLAARPELARRDPGPLAPRPRHPRLSRRGKQLRGSHARAALGPAGQAGRGNEGTDRAGQFRCPAARWSLRLLAQIRPRRRAPAHRAGAERRRAGTDPARRTYAGGGQILFLVRRIPPQSGPPPVRLHRRRDRLRELRPAHPRYRHGARSAGGHSGGPHLHLGARRPHAVLCPARRRASRALRLPPPGRQRPEQ